MIAEPLTYPHSIQNKSLLSPDNERREIWNGRKIVMPSPNVKHQKLYRRLLLQLEAWVAAGGGGLLYYQPVDLRMSEDKIVIPDITFYLNTNESEVEAPGGGSLVGVPDLVVEIISPSSVRIDRVQKYRAYAEFGVRHYWIIDSESRVLQAYRWEENRFVDEAVMSDEDQFSPQLFPGLTLNLNELFGPEDAENL